jgi:CheY-like chemotaxis protein
MPDNIPVLYVEDDPPSRDIMRLMLVELMRLTHVTIFEDSADFAARVQALDPRPGMVLLDIHVQPISGFAMLGIVRSLPGFETTPVVALTASVMNEEIQRLRNAGFDGVLPKPIDVDTFPDTFERLLRGERLWRVL